MRHLKEFNEGLFDIFKTNKDSKSYKIKVIKEELRKLIDTNKFKVFNTDKYHISKDYDMLWWQSGYNKPLYYKINDDFSVILHCDLLIENMKTDISININSISGNLHIKNCIFNRKSDSNLFVTNVGGNVIVERTTKLPFIFDDIDGDFSLKNSNGFEDFDKLPRIVGGTLYLKNNSIKTLSGLRTEMVMNQIDISDNRITSLNFLENIKGYKRVKAGNNKIYSLDLLNELEVEIQGNPISEIGLTWIASSKDALDLFNDFDPIRPMSHDLELPILYKDRIEMFIDYYKSGNFPKVVSNSFLSRLTIDNILDKAKNIYDIR